MKFYRLRDDGRAPKQKMVDDTIENFKTTGESTHSTDGALLAPLLNYCVQKKIAFELHHVPGGGYWVKKTHTPRLSEGHDRLDHLNRR